MVEPDGVVTRMLLGLFSSPHSILYPGGRKVLNPWMRLGWPANRSDTRLMTPGVSILVECQPRQTQPGSTRAVHLRLALEVLHDVEKAVVHVGLVVELHLHLVEVAEGILVCFPLASTCRGALQTLRGRATNIQDGLLAVREPARRTGRAAGAGARAGAPWAGVAGGQRPSEGSRLDATTALGLERSAEHGAAGGPQGVGGGAEPCGMGANMCCWDGRIVLAAVRQRRRPARLAVQRPAEARSRTGRRAQRHGRRCCAVVCQQAAGAVDGSGDSRGHGLVDGQRAGGAVVGRRARGVGLALVSLVLVALALALLGGLSRPAAASRGAAARRAHVRARGRGRGRGRSRRHGATGCSWF